MQSVGQLLRNARLAQGRTLDEVRASTRISFRTLEAIEADELNAVSSAFLYRSFARQFAADVGLDCAQLETSLKSATESMPVPLVPGQAESSAPKVAALRIGGKRKNSRWLYSLGSFALILLACSTLYALWQSSRFSFHTVSRPGRSEEVKQIEPAPAVAPPQVRSAETLSSSAPASNPGANLPAATPVPSNHGLRIEISATEPTWVAAFADGKRSFSGTLEAAEIKFVEGRENARIRTGNAGGVKVIFNGKLLGALGPRGQIRTVLFTKDRYEVLDDPAHIVLTGFTRSGEEASVLHPLALLPAF